MLTAYLDETGQEQDEWMFIAGFMGDDAAWRKFPDLWAEAIGPQRKHLHMKSLRFSKVPVKKMLERAALVPKECGLIPILAGARLRDYADMLHQEEDSVTHAAYIMCCRGIAIFAMRSIPANERLEIVLERQDRYGRSAAEELQKIAETTQHPELLMADGNTSKLASWRFINKNDTVLCEPADYLAYACLQQARDKNSLKSRWTYPIIAAHPGAGFGGLIRREHARGVIIGQKKQKALDAIETLKKHIVQGESERIQSETLSDGAGA